MFVAVAKITLSIPEAGSLKSKRHVLHKVLDKVRTRFNVSIAEVEDNDLWQKATLGVATVANEHAFAQECLDKVLKFIEDLYVAPVISSSTEIVPLKGELYGDDDGSSNGSAARGVQRTLADAEREAGERTLAADRSVYGSRRGRAGQRQPMGRGHRKAMSEREREQAIEDLRQRLREGRRDGGDEGPGSAT
jgi:uncharacterized protein YlxP (DUF503 family)